MAGGHIRGEIILELTVKATSILDPVGWNIVLSPPSHWTVYKQDLGAYIIRA